MGYKRYAFAVIAGIAAVFALAMHAGFGRAEDGAREAASLSITVYSGRARQLVAPVFESFERETGIRVRVRYGGTAELAALLLEEGARTPADVFFAQDAGALAAVERAGRFRPLPESLRRTVDPRFVSRASETGGGWVGVTGRARAIVYNTDLVDPAALPQTLEEVLGGEWAGKVGYPPSNASFQAMVSAMRARDGDEKTIEWLRALRASGAKTYANNTETVRAVASGEVAIGLVNHYYALRMLAETPGLSVANFYMTGDDAGSLVNVSGVGLMQRRRGTDATRDAAAKLAEYLLSESAQRYFATETFEYPLARGVEPPTGAPALERVGAGTVDLNALSDLEGTLRLMSRAGVLP
ncbi:MAG: extracellular solute-binding protein [Phycisphaerales bacterium]|nr:extracellular solute-binding protein [Phycisphaerales bacterium]